jgi:hypothetical protein
MVSIVKLSIAIILYQYIICILGVVIENVAENYTVGSDASITCRSDTETERMEWLTQERTVIVLESNVTRLNLIFTPVNDSIHGQVYICRVIRSGSDMPEQNFTMNVEQNFTMNVEGWYKDGAIYINMTCHACAYFDSSSSCRNCTGFEHYSNEKH